MTLVEIVSRHPELFASQTWYVLEPFMQREAVVLPPVVLVNAELESGPEIHAADLALAYVSDPDALWWRRFVWTSDYDSHGNRVYVGGCGLYGVERWQIHRHLAKPDAWYPRFA